MNPYILTKDAENDLRDIARYTLEKHGAKQLQTYRKKINSRLNKIAKGEVIARSFSRRFPQVLVTQCEHHFIFYITDNVQKPLIIGIIHENRDMVARVKERPL